jgi:hypothetical protein
MITASSLYLLGQHRIPLIFRHNLGEIENHPAARYPPLRSLNVMALLLTASTTA